MNGSYLVVETQHRFPAGPERRPMVGSVSSCLPLLRSIKLMIGMRNPFGV